MTEIYNDFNLFSSDLIEVSSDKDIIAYMGVPVHSRKGIESLEYNEDLQGKTLKINHRLVGKGTVVDGLELTEKQAISLWQQVYLTINTVHDPKKIAYLYREIHGICHCCCGLGYVPDLSFVQNLEEAFDEANLSKIESNKDIKVVKCFQCKGTGRLS